MKLTIDDNKLKENDIDLPTLLAILLVKTGANVPALLEDLCKKEVFIKDTLGGLVVTRNWENRCSKTLLSGDSEVPEEDRLTALVDKLRDIYPKGKKPGTSTYWRGNRKDVALKLQKFFKLYNSTYTDGQIIEAATRYVASFNGNYSYMRVLIYFILKNVRKEGPNGVGFIEEVSDLASYIENEDIKSNDDTWGIELR